MIELSIQHLNVVLLSLAIATLLGVLISLLVFRSTTRSAAVLAITSSFMTIPSFALFGLLIPLFGLGYTPTIVALVMYALLPVVRNTITGLQEVDPSIIEAARGMGMRKHQSLLRVRLPLAWPVIVAGMRVSAMMIMGIAAIAAYVNGPGLGGDIFSGLSRIGTVFAEYMVLSATLAVVLLSLALDLILALFARLTTSKGIR
ncbi:MAG: ABC transporter permease [Gaiellales bacterium]